LASSTTSLHCPLSLIFSFHPFTSIFFKFKLSVVCYNLQVHTADWSVHLFYSYMSTNLWDLWYFSFCSDSSNSKFVSQVRVVARYWLVWRTADWRFCQPNVRVSLIIWWITDAFTALQAHIKLILSVHVSISSSVYMHESTQELLDGFSWNLIFGSSTNIC
jgi:hypothetical protein